MSQISNFPATRTVLRLAARKSFSLAVWLSDSTGRSLELGSSSLRIVAKKPPFNTADTSDADNIIQNNQAMIESAVDGYAQFNFQASDLDHEPGEYPFVIVLTESGFSSVLVQGVLELLENPDFDSADETFNPGEPNSALQIMLQNRQVLRVTAGGALAPGTTSFTDGDKAKLDLLEQPNWLAEDSGPGGILNKPGTLLPQGGGPLSGLVKRSSQDQDAIWAQLPIVKVPLLFPGDDTLPGDGTLPLGWNGGALAATGVPEGYVPTASGVGTWDWESSERTLDDVADTATRLAMTPEERGKLADIDAGAIAVTWDSVTGKPEFGSAALQSADSFRSSATPVPGNQIGGGVPAGVLPAVAFLNGWVYGTTIPTSIPAGGIYIQYEA